MLFHETKRFRIELQGFVLVFHKYTGKYDFHIVISPCYRTVSGTDVAQTYDGFPTALIDNRPLR